MVQALVVRRFCGWQIQSWLVGVNLWQFCFPATVLLSMVDCIRNAAPTRRQIKGCVHTPQLGALLVQIVVRKPALGSKYTVLSCCDFWRLDPPSYTTILQHVRLGATDLS